ncbi:MAG: cell division protein FtsZ [Proteobacteria bacterium]|nr:cell division protein FtsZ [Pseudomonadota bacterium]MDA0913692.1 cell division protein FtsZ [Pseudomonadota bacterium]MDA1032437.1 cell division protein FtsZ [Pseudomonadota bacterium]
MSINIGPASSDELRPRITVVGIGGAGGNAIANMIESEIEGVDFICANTDAQALSMSKADSKIQLGPEITGGLGAGARPEVGKAAAEETVKEIEDALEGVNMVFIAAGMGGGTGTGAAPVIAEAARRKGVLTVGVVTKPFLFEGTRRMRAAEAGIDELQKHVDTLIVIPNQNLFLIAKAETTFKEAFQLADEVLQQGVRSITDLMVMPGLINLDFADVRSVMSEMGKAMMGTGEAEGESRALEAAERAIANPLLDGVTMRGAKGVIISIIGGEDMKLLEVDEAANHIRELVDEDANIIWGSAFNPDLDGKIRVSVVATGIDQSAISATTETAPISLSASRPPKRPVIALSKEELETVEEPIIDEPLQLVMEAEPEPDPCGAAEEVEEAAPVLEPFDLTGMQVGEDMGESEEDDVDDIVDPLAGMLNEDNDPDADDMADELAEEAPFDLMSEVSPEPSVGREAVPASREGLGGDPSEIGSSGASGSSGSSGRGAAPTAASAGGSTLFERMANLSRGASDRDDDDEGGSSLSIPRFLGRQNNQ